MAGKKPTGPTKKQLWYYDQRKKYPSIRATAKALGVNYTAVRQALIACQSYGLPVDPERHHPHIPVGHLTGKITTQVDYRENDKGKVVQEWIRSTPAEQSLEAIIEHLRHRVPTCPTEEVAIDGYDPEVMLQIDLADLHIGMQAWKLETGDDNYDLKIVRSLVSALISEIFVRSGKVAEVVLVLYGDNFHSDFFKAVTEESRNPLDTDGRFPKIIKVGWEIFAATVETCAANADHVTVIELRGNHDNQSSCWLQMLLHLYYGLALPKRVQVDMSPAKTRYHVWGCVAQNFHHGDKTTPERLAADIRDYCLRSDLTGIRELRANQAHLHKEERRDINGVLYECKPSPVAKDAFAASSNYGSRRAVIATKFHKQLGELSRYTVTPRQVELKARGLIAA